MRILLMPFWNAEQRRPRTFWRLLLFFLTLIVLIYAAVRFLHLGSDLLSSSLVNAGSSLLAAWIAARVWDRRPFAEYGFHLNRGWWRDLGLGFLLGALLMSLIFLTEWLLGWVRVVGVFHTYDSQGGFWPNWAKGLLMFIAVGLAEELISRGYLIRNLAEGLRFPPLGQRGGLVAAWLLSSTFFGLLHLGNPNVTLFSTVNLIVAGLFLGLAYILTDELALPIGLHIAWNFFQGNVFGFPVSGLAGLYASLLFTQETGPDVWTGGAFGPEGGLLGLLAMLFGMGLLVWVKGPRLMDR